MKKSICKGDKKRKKEITEEVVKLESDLDRRHDEEMANFKLTKLTVTGLPNNEIIIKPNDNNDDSDDDNNKPGESSGQRISKAQKRRDKKAQAEKIRNQRILEQEELNIFGKRNVEIQTIKKILGERDLMLYEIPSDGHW